MSRIIISVAQCLNAELDDKECILFIRPVMDQWYAAIVVNKPARLSDEEFELIKKHPVIGAEILERIKEKPKLATGARWHHERYGGGGYPDGLSGEDIPVEARIIAVADAYDAMTSRRSYRDVIPQEKVRKEIENGMGTQFDPEYAKVMLQMIDEDTDYQMREIKEE